MTDANQFFSPAIKDFLERLDLSAGEKPGAWSVIWDLSQAKKDPQFGELHPGIYQSVKDEILAMQFIDLGALTLAALHLKPGHGIEIEPSPVNLADHISGMNKFWALQMGRDVIYYAVTAPLLIELQNRLLIVLKARNLLDRLVKGDLKPIRSGFLPEVAVVEFMAVQYGLKSVQCRHEEYYYNDQRFRYVKIMANLSDPAVTVRVYIFDRPGSLSWLRSQARDIPEDDQTEFGRTIYRCMKNLLVVVKEDFGKRSGTGAMFSLDREFDGLFARLIGMELPMTEISVVTVHKTDPDFEWRTMLGKF